MAYYMKKDRDKNTEDPAKKPKASREMKSFYQILGCILVLIVFLIIWAVRG